MLANESSLASTLSRSALALALGGLAGLDARRLLADAHRAGSASPPDDAPLRIALARELRLAELLVGQRLVVDDLPAHVIRAALAMFHRLGQSDQLAPANDSGDAERLTAWGAATMLVGALITSCTQRECSGRLGNVSLLQLSEAGNTLRVFAVPAVGSRQAHLVVNELNAAGRHVGELDVRRLAGATIDDVVPMIGLLPDEAPAVWLRASQRTGGRLHAVMLAEAHNEAKPAGATLVFERCSRDG
jgi:hypothetical protein